MARKPELEKIDTVKDLRVRLGLTQSEFAHILKTTQCTVSNWEVGRFRPRSSKFFYMIQVAKKRGLNLDENYFFDNAYEGH